MKYCLSVKNYTTLLRSDIRRLFTTDNKNKTYVHIQGVLKEYNNSLHICENLNNNKTLNNMTLCVQSRILGFEPASFLRNTFISAWLYLIFMSQNKQYNVTELT